MPFLDFVYTMHTHTHTLHKKVNEKSVRCPITPPTTRSNSSLLTINHSRDLWAALWVGIIFVDNSQCSAVPPPSSSLLSDRLIPLVMLRPMFPGTDWTREREKQAAADEWGEPGRSLGLNIQCTCSYSRLGPVTSLSLSQLDRQDWKARCKAMTYEIIAPAHPGRSLYGTGWGGGGRPIGRGEDKKFYCVAIFPVNLAKTWRWSDL